MSDTDTKQLLDAALAYAANGFLVFPCKVGAKTPATQNGHKDATTDPEQIEKWWSHADYNIGIPTAGLLVVDVDGKDNHWPGDSDKAYELSRGAMSLTPSGGCHYVFKEPPDKELRNTTGKLAPNVDTRASGGYIVVAPSVADGKPYKWVETFELEKPEDLPFPPAWVIDDLTNGTIEIHETPEAENDIPSGQRNDTLIRLAGNMRRVGMSEAEMRASLLIVNTDRCKPPMPEHEVAKVARSAARYDPDQIATATIEDHWTQDRSQATEPRLEDPGPIPEDLLRAPGFVSDIMDHCLETAPYPNPVMAFAGAFTLQAFLAGRKVRGPGDVRTNIYLLGLAHSAAGKDHPRKVNAHIMHQIGMDHCLGDRFASGEGIQDVMYLNPAMLYQTDEIDGMLQSINKAKDAKHENIMGTLLTMFSSSNSIFPMRAKAGNERPGAIDQPCLCIFGTAIPTHWYGALSDRMLSNGFFARFIILEALKRQAGQNAGIISPSKQIIETAQFWANMKTKGNLGDQHPKPIVVPHTRQAAAALEHARQIADAAYAAAEEANDPVGTTVWGRVSEQILKFSLIYACSRNHRDLVTEIGDVEWATEVIMRQTQRMLFMAQKNVSDNPFHADCLKVLKQLNDASGNHLPHSILLKRMKMDSKSFQNVVRTMQEQGDIRQIQEKTGGRPRILYVLTK